MKRNSPLCHYLVATLSLCFLFACSFPKTDTLSDDDVESASLVTINIKSPEEVGNTETSTVSKEFDSVKYIFLQTSRESLIGQITQMEVVDDKLVIYDGSANSIKIFNNQGVFKTSIPAKTQFFSIDYQKKEIHFQAMEKLNTYYKYSLNGKFIASYVNVLAVRSFADLDSGNTAFYVPDNNEYQRKILKDQYGLTQPTMLFIQKAKTVQFLLSNCNKDINSSDLVSSRKSFYKHDGGYYFIPPYTYTIYSLSNHGVSKAFKFNIPEQFNLPADFVSNDKYLGRHIPYLKKNPEKIFLISDFYRVKNSIFFKLQAEKTQYNDIYRYEINKEKIIPFASIGSDSASFYLPYCFSKLLTSDKKSIYTFSPASILVKHFFSLPEKYKHQTPLAQLNKLRALKNKDNPVIIQLYPKF